MTAPAPIAICLLAHGHAPAAFLRCFWSVLNHTPLERIELRLGFSRATKSFHSALGATCPDCRFPEFQQLPDGIEQFRWTAREGFRVLAWHCTSGVAREQLIRLMHNDVALAGEYAIMLDQHSFVEAGWWDTLLPLLERGTDYIGQPAWHTYRPGEAERLAACPWFMGVPLARREGQAGVAFMRAGFMAVRAERLREANLPQPGCRAALEVQLGEIAHQLGWTQAVHDQYVQVNQPSAVSIVESGVAL